MSRPKSKNPTAPKCPAIEIKVLRKSDRNTLSNVARGVFDNAINLKSTLEFLRDPRHHMAVALENGLVVGMASAVHYVHPDKAPELWINEVAVAKTHRRQGVGSALVAQLLEIGRRHGCVEAWVLTEQNNRAAIRLYSSQGGKRAPKDPVMFTFRLRAARHKSK
ncbi:MAG TPA: GNAT family N-acetyltransferase [Tepidisphaeraceae bacterium]|nr:GNAT family N-acetyltransferase [Tepidisphaeraceae bacterium]